MFKNHGVASIQQLHDITKESGAELIACQMTMNVMGYQQSEFIEGVEFGGAATWMDIVAKADINLFV
jgi:peroxiredoxin family protein